MSTYVGLGSRYAQGQPDISGLNSGNWTVAFTAPTLNVNIAFFEIHHIVVKGAPGTTFTVWINNRQWGAAARGDINEWDPNQPMQLNPGDDVLFMYSDPVTDGKPPVITVWLRYDQDIEANRGSYYQ